MTVKVYFDLDDTLTDFSGALLTRGIINETGFIHKPKSEWSSYQIELDRKVTSLMETVGFWKSLPLKVGSKKMWDLYRGSRGIITAYPRMASNPEQVTKEKFEWCRDRLGLYGDDTFVCCQRAEKSKYATNKDGTSNILVDDLEVNCNEWVEAGGEAVLFKGDIARTVRIVDRLLDVI